MLKGIGLLINKKIVKQKPGNKLPGFCFII